RVDWTYDALGRRVRQVRYVWTNGTRQVVEDLKLVSDPVMFGRPIAELNGTNGALVRSYVWGLDLSETLDGAGGVGGLLWVRLNTSPASGVHFVTYDGNGNVWTLVSASTGTETARYEYGPFGEPLRLTGAAAGWNPFRFSTKRSEDATGLVLYEYRAYSPALGRWLSRDPLGEQPGSFSLRSGPASLVGAQPYAFVLNAPVFRYDVLGLVPPMEVPWWPPKCDPPPLPSPCDVAAHLIRSFLSTPQEKAAWDRYVSGTGGTWKLSCSEMRSVLSAARAANGMTVLDMIEAERRRCEYGFLGYPNSDWWKSHWWMSQRKEVVAVGAPWECALGNVELTIYTACECNKFFYSVCLKDRYDFDPKWLETHRSWFGEFYVTVVWAAQNALKCGWRPYQITGCYHGALCTF
ncbi:RHS repeat-associated core domain-containing protein, partial [Limisphaera ngatamarikiensis]